MNSSKPVIGLVGGIGAGKSTVANALIRHGGKVVAADPLGHEALEQPDIFARVVEVWGDRGILTPDGKIDRKKFGRIVFPSPVERSRLEHLVHPYIEQRIREEIDKAKADSTAKFVVLDAAIMLEAGWDGVCDKLIYVDAPRAIRLARVQQQRHWTDQDLANREAVQMPPEKKKERANVVIDNGGSPEATIAQVDELVQRWELV
ncbi:MAG TPA: dephospho-CoA kinase [Gemmataceae bacterium]|jgi:dephospho-CoA kinase|nr:dephospho-CoA kinase [Gemmataceae bacterium]